MAKTPKTDEELVEALRRHVTLLKEYHEKAFEKGDADYYGEVAETTPAYIS